MDKDLFLSAHYFFFISLPVPIREASSLHCLKYLLKTHLFEAAYF